MENLTKQITAVLLTETYDFLPLKLSNVIDKGWHNCILNADVPLDMVCLSNTDNYFKKLTEETGKEYYATVDDCGLIRGRPPVMFLNKGNVVLFGNVIITAYKKGSDYAVNMTNKEIDALAYFLQTM